MVDLLSPVPSLSPGEFMSHSSQLYFFPTSPPSLAGSRSRLSQRTVTDGVSIAMLFVTAVPFPALPPADHTLLSVDPRSSPKSSWHPELGWAQPHQPPTPRNTSCFSLTLLPHVLNLQGNIQNKIMESTPWGSALTLLQCLQGAGSEGHPFVPAGGEGDQEQPRGVPSMCCMSHVLS